MLIRRKTCDSTAAITTHSGVLYVTIRTIDAMVTVRAIMMAVIAVTTMTTTATIAITDTTVAIAMDLVCIFL